MGWLKDQYNTLFRQVGTDAVHNDINGNYGTPIHTLNGTPEFNDYIGDSKKLRMVFSSPAVLKVFKLQCDLFSLGKFYIYDKNDILVKGSDPLTDKLNNPNPFQSKSQFLWDSMFWKMLGTEFIYTNSAVINNPLLKIYHLEPHKIEWPDSLTKLQDKLILSNKSIEEIMKTNVTYRYDDGTSILIPLSDIMITGDLTNGTGNWFKSNSTLDALHKIVSNSEAILDANNINIKFSGKFLVAGQADPENVNDMPMDETEKNDIERKMNGRRIVHAVKTMIEIKRFVENLGQLKFDDSYLAQYFFIGSMYNIPRDVLEAYKSSTYENQEKARGGHVAYTLEPSGEELCGKLTKRFEYDKLGKKLVLSWDHLPFMQIFEQQRVTALKSKADTFVILLNAGVALDEVNRYLDTDFKSGEKQVIQQQQNGEGNQTGNQNSN